MNNNTRQISNISTSSLFNGDELSGDLSNQIHHENNNFTTIIAEQGGGCFPFERRIKPLKYAQNVSHQTAIEGKDNVESAETRAGLPSLSPSFLKKAQIPLLPFSLLTLRVQMLTEMQSKLNIFYELKDEQSRAEFRKFTQTKAPSRYLLFILFLFTFFFFPVAAWSLLNDATTMNEEKRMFRVAISLIAVLSCCLTIFSGWKMYSQYRSFKSLLNKCKQLFFGVHSTDPISDEDTERNFAENETIESTLPTAVFHKKHHSSSYLFGKQSLSMRFLKHLRSIFCGPLLPESLSYVTYMLVISMQVYFCTIFVRRVFSLNCQGGASMRFAVIFGSGLCYEDDVKMQMMSFNALLLMLYPFMFLVSVPEVCIRLIWLVFSMSIGVYIVSAIALNLYESFPLVFTWMCIGFFVIKDNQLRNLLVFLSHKKLEELVSENQRINELNHANEMRHLISNVAHDLKTPLSSFTTGIDLIQYTLDDYETKTQMENMSPKASSPMSAEKLAKEQLIPAVQICLDNIRNTNAFMLMTINRCIDYSKASKGLELVPVEENFDLAEIIQMPLVCMRNIQSRIPVILKTFSADIQPHIITDKQWLQENLLCLLSNAVKYSTSGEVHLSVTLQGIDQCVSPQISPLDFGSNDINDDSVGSSTGDYSGQLLRSKSRSFKLEKAGSSKIHPSISEDESILPTMQMSSAPGELSESKDTNNEYAHQQQGPVLHAASPSTPTSIIKGRKNMVAKIKHIQHRRRSTFSNKKYHTNSSLMFEVEDHGIGMTEEDMNVLFSPWNQTQRLAGGTGLGLYSLAKRIEAIGGKYGVRKRNDMQQGSVFWFTIPYRPEVLEEEQSVDVGNAGTNPSIQDSRARVVDFSTEINHIQVLRSPTNGNKTGPMNATLLRTPSSKQSSVYLSYENTLNLDILIVDDSPAILKMTSMMLKKLGHQVKTAEHGLIALEMIKDRWKNHQEKFDLVLMDLQMPVMDGLEATMRIRQLELSSDPHESLPKQIIIAVSANSDHEAVKAAYDAGANSFMGKPFDITTFYETVRSTVLTTTFESTAPLPVEAK